MLGKQQKFGNFLREIEGGGSVRIKPSRQLLDDCTHKRNNLERID